MVNSSIVAHRKCIVNWTITASKSTIIHSPTLSKYKKLNYEKEKTKNDIKYYMIFAITIIIGIAIVSDWEHFKEGIMSAFNWFVKRLNESNNSRKYYEWNINLWEL